MKYSLIIFLSFLLGLKVDGQVNLQTFISIYNKNSLSEAIKSLRAIPDFQLTDSLKVDSLIGNINEGKINANIKHNKTNIRFSFTNETLYNALYKQAEQKFKYTTDYARGTKGNGTSRHTTSFSNY